MEWLFGTEKKGKVELRQDSGETSTGTATTIAMAVGAAAVAAWGIFSLLSDNAETSKSSGKMMKAPGKSPSTMMRRDVFEANPKQYFSNHRGKR
ncbi:hypothetical protein L1887_32162 [Cichorium endivia]|nr:hypothetical protein L1887_32162 [Cichorium endivia]